MVSGSKAPDAATRDLVSIVIPCCGMLEYTKLCVPGVLAHSRAPFELIFLDIGSLDGSAEYLAGVAAAAQVRVEIVRTELDLGIPEACKEALSRTRGGYIVLLNNDTIVSSGWLNQLIALLSMSPAVGMVGPMSNYAAPPQLVEVVPYRVGPRRRSADPAERLVNTTAIDDFARLFREEQKGKWLQVERLGGFCLMLKREVLARIESIDEWSDLGLFDTDILSTKVREAGYTLACCRDLFIHHFGTRTFAHGSSRADQPDRAAKAD